MRNLSSAGKSTVAESVTPPMLVVDEVAARLRCSRRAIHELTRTRSIPHRKLAGSRRILFLEDELARWIDGADLEIIELRDGGRIVRVLPSNSTNSGAQLS